MVRRNLRAREDGFRDVRPVVPARGPRWYRVKVDMQRLRSHLTPEGRVMTDEQGLRRWLRKSGFEEQGEWWVVRESELGQLGPSEVAEAEPIDG